MKRSINIYEAKSNSELQQTAALADEIWHECYADLLQKEQIDYMVEKFQSRQAIEKQVANEGYHYFIVEADGEPCGYLGMQPKNGKVLLSKIYLKSAMRGRGIAAEMFSFTEAYTRKQGCSAYWLTVNRGNERAKAAYHKAGMVVVREQVTDIGGGFVMDDYVFEKPL